MCLENMMWNGSKQHHVLDLLQHLNTGIHNEERWMGGWVCVNI
jgi:hypothetical protein